MTMKVLARGRLIGGWRLANFAPALIRDHHEQQANNLRHEIETVLTLLIRFADSFGPEAVAFASEAADLIRFDPGV